MGKIIFRGLVAIVIVGYGFLILPKHIVTIIDYFKLKGQTNNLTLQLKNVNGDLMSAKEVDELVKKSGCTIKLCTVMDSVNNSDVRSYNGEDLEDNGCKILEYIIEPKNDVDQILSFLNNYDFSYSNIALSDEELVLQIYCN